MNKRKLLKLFCMSLSLLMLCGCGGPDVPENTGNDMVDEEEEELYEVDYCGQKDLFKKAEDEYEAGEKVKLYYDVIATDTDYTFYLDDEILDVDYSEEKGYIIRFTMPDHDVTLRVEMSNTMEPVSDHLYDLLLDNAGCSDDEVIVFERDDYDSDGNEEAFAIVGEEIEPYDDGTVYVDGEVWFVSENECRIIHRTFGLGTGEEARHMTLGDVNYILFDEFFVSESYSFVFYVDKGEVWETDYSGLGYVLASEDEENRFTITDSSYDMMDEPDIGLIGHTWKKYYFFYDSEYGNTYEYAGTTIDEATVSYWCDDIIVNEIVPEGSTVSNIFMRGNGLIVINFETEEDDGSIRYYHFIYSTEKESFIDDAGKETDSTPLDGIYLNCLCSMMASYPEVPGPGGIVWYGE